MIVPHADETLRNYVSWAEVTPDANFYWSGTTPRLATNDDATSYAHINVDGAGQIVSPTVTFAPFTLNPSRPAVGRARVRRVGGNDGAEFELFLSDGDGNNYTFGDAPTGAAGEWFTVGPVTFDPADLVWLVAAASAGEVMSGVVGNYGGDPVDYFEVSYIELVHGGDVPHQIFQRGDSLGAGGGLVFGPSTRQSSGLVFGTH